jgi:hypothetical protein
MCMSRTALLACLMMVASAAFPAFPAVEAPALPEGSAGARAVPRFANASDEAGLSGIGGNFFAWGDCDADGHQDLLVDGQRLFRNDGPPSWTFTEVTAGAGIGGSGANCGNFADYDNDGLLDIYCPSGGWSTDFDPRWDVLWHNNGDGTFSNVTEAAGHVTDSFPSVAAGWGDYDRDGFVDLYVANYENASMSAYYPDTLWHNDGDGTFTNVTVSAGVDESADPKPGRGVSWCDYNNDGWPDVYISNYRLKANYLYRNDGDGTFTEVAASAGVAGEPTNRLGQTYYGHSVGAAWSDINNDGIFDLWVTNLAHKDAYRGPICDDSELYLANNPSANFSFTNIRSSSGIATKRIMGGEDELFVGCAWGDLDNDGFEDLFLPQIYNDVPYAYSLLYRNNGNNTFTDISNETGVRVWDTYGGAWCDYDEDGDLDLVTGGKGTTDVNGTHEIHLYKNLLNDQGPSSWLELRLKGSKSNFAAIGARVYVNYSGLSQMREVQGGMGPHSMQNSMVLHFGLPTGISTVSVNIRWPSGMGQSFTFQAGNGELDRMVDITETSTQADLTPTALAFDPPSPVEGEMVLLCATVKNIGRSPSTSYQVEFHDGPASLWSTVVNETLAPGDSRAFKYSWSTAGKAGQRDIGVLAMSKAPSDDNRANDALRRIITISPGAGNLRPVAVLSVTPASVQTGEPVNFDGGSSSDPDGSVTAYEYTFGDGQSSGWVQDTVVQHSYSTAGTYTAALRVRDNASMVSGNDARAAITVSLPPNQPPTARIASILPSPARAGDAVTFNGDAYDPDGTVAAFQWTSSIDGDLSTEKSFTTSGLSQGSHTIGFRVRDDRGAWSPLVTRGLDVQPPAVNQPPAARIISISPSPATAGQTVKLNGIGEDSDGAVVEYRWSSSLQGVLGTGTPLSVANLVEGVHYITLAVKDDAGAWSAEAQSRLEVRPAGGTEAPNKAPTASLSVSRSVIQVNEVFRLDGGDSVDPDGRVMEFFFDFGDGTDSCWTVSASVDHSYKSSGQFVVRLKVRDDKGAQSRWSREVIVEVKAKKAPVPAKAFISGMEAAALLPAALVALVLVARRRRTRP